MKRRLGLFSFDKEHYRGPMRLSVTAARIVACWNMGLSPRKTVNLLRPPEFPADEWWITCRGVMGKLRRSKDPRVRQWVDVGLPAGFTVALPPGRKVLCHLCGELVACVPCLECSLIAGVTPETLRTTPDLPRPAAPTSAVPGTRDKIEVMRRRCEAGEALFHPEDAVMPAFDCAT